MRNGVCPKCGGSEVYGAANGLGIGGPTTASLHGHIEAGFRGMRPQQRTDGVHQFLCAACGHLELYVIDPTAVEFARRHWVRVQPPA